LRHQPEHPEGAQDTAADGAHARYRKHNLAPDGTGMESD
jgi:hypothetical protein